MGFYHVKKMEYTLNYFPILCILYVQMVMIIISYGKEEEQNDCEFSNGNDSANTK